MKKIEVIIRPEKLDIVFKVLETVGYLGITITEIEGYGRQKGVTCKRQGEDSSVELMSKTKLELVVNNKDVEAIVNTIIDNLKTGEIGDGKIFIHNIENAIRIRTGEKGEKAL
ncbi:MAG: P-II family nitrogen regulator [bacterium]|nr:P-II family nitrogen regulator [bacterium]